MEEPGQSRRDDMRTFLSLKERLWGRVDKNGPNGCWVWIGGTSDTGYGTIRGTINGNPKGLYVHRVAYEFMRGGIPAGLHIDHLCRNKRCVNPDHLEPVTQKENSLRGISPNAINARKKKCKWGHPLSGKNLYIRKVGQRMCLRCTKYWQWCNRHGIKRSDVMP
jgi:hypothetical protein